MRHHITLFVLFFSAFTLSGQQPALNTIPVKDIDQLILPKQDNQALQEAELQRRGPGIAPQFALPVQVLVTPESHGTWEITRDGKAVWRLYIQSAGAKSLNLGFTKYFMPPGGELLLYSPDVNHLMGPFTPADNEEHEQLWTPILEGDELVIEVRLAPEHMEDLQLELSWVNHDYLGFKDMSSLLSGACNLDVVCGEDDGWSIVDDYRDIIQSVAVISTGGSTFCSGFLVNNANQDCTPYFMTAFHCGINSVNDASLVTYWNYQNSVCRQPNSPASGQPGDGVLTDFNTGSTLRASYSQSDFVLVELDDPVSETANAFFAGWSAEDVAPTSSIGVHHPGTDEKRISFENQASNLTTYLSNASTSNYTHVRVADWDIGTTEGGSSGSPLFDQNKRVVGQLHGGFAACGNNDPDWYGSFHVSWEGGGTPTTRLKDWLDPNNTGMLTLDGRMQEACSFFVGIDPVVDLCAGNDISLEVEVSEAFNGPVTLSLSGEPVGADYSFSPNPAMPGTTSILSIENTFPLPIGDYEITIMGSDGADDAANLFTLNVYFGTPLIPMAVSPEDGANDVNISTSIQWSGTTNTQTYDYEVALDPGFTDILVAESGITGTNADLPILDPQTSYYWRVRSNNPCDQSDWSTGYMFITANIVCNMAFPNDLPVTISDVGTPTVTSTLEIPFEGEILDVNVLDLSGLHTYLGDLIFDLTSPEGTTITLISGECGSQNNFDISFDDQAPAGPTPCPYNDGGTYQPLGNLSAFNGENSQGTWTLTIYDTFDDDGGVLQNWSLEICVIESAYVGVSPAILSACPGDVYNFSLLMSSGFTGPVTVNVNAPGGTTASVSPNPVSPGETATLSIDETSSLSPGSYPITIEATDGSTTETVTATMIVEGLPAASAQTLPAPGSINISVNTTFEWTVSPEADDYLFELNDSPDFSDPMISEVVPSNVYDPGIQLDYETQYYWQVTSQSSCGSETSETESFTTEFLESTTAIEGIRFEISPNPTREELLISFSDALPHDLLVSVYTVDGRELQAQEIGAGTRHLTLEFNDYPSGVYLLRMYNELGSTTQRIVKID